MYRTEESIPIRHDFERAFRNDVASQLWLYLLKSFSQCRGIRNGQFNGWQEPISCLTPVLHLRLVRPLLTMLLIWLTLLLLLMLLLLWSLPLVAVVIALLGILVWTLLLARSLLVTLLGVALLLLFLLLLVLGRASTSTPAVLVATTLVVVAGVLWLLSLGCVLLLWFAFRSLVILGTVVALISVTTWLNGYRYPVTWA